MRDRDWENIRQQKIRLLKDADNKKEAAKKVEWQKEVAFFANVNAVLNILINHLVRLRRKKKENELSAFRDNMRMKYMKRRRRRASRDEDKEDQKRIEDEARKADKEKILVLPIAQEFGTAIEMLIAAQKEGILPSEGLLDVVLFLRQEGVSLVKNLTQVLINTVDTVLPARDLINTSLQYIKENLKNLARLEATILKPDPALALQKSGELIFSKGPNQEAERSVPGTDRRPKGP